MCHQDLSGKRNKKDDDNEGGEGNDEKSLFGRMRQKIVGK